MKVTSLDNRLAQTPASQLALIDPAAHECSWDLQLLACPSAPASAQDLAGQWNLVSMLREWTADGFVTRNFASFAAPFVSAPVVEQTPEAPKTVAPGPQAKAPGGVSDKGVSVNTARAEELAAVKGLTAKLAEGIVTKRPFASLDDLRQVKGLGAKILAKVRSGLKL